MFPSMENEDEEYKLLILFLSLNCRLAQEDSDGGEFGSDILVDENGPVMVEEYENAPEVNYIQINSL